MFEWILIFDNNNNFQGDHVHHASYYFSNSTYGSGNIISLRYSGASTFVLRMRCGSKEPFRLINLDGILLP